MKDITISVIVPVYNRENLLDDVRSLMSQSIGINNFEIILVDDKKIDHQIKFIRLFRRN